METSVFNRRAAFVVGGRVSTAKTSLININNRTFLGCFATDVGWFVILWFVVGPDLHFLFISTQSASLFLFWMMAFEHSLSDLRSEETEAAAD